jgi:uncharacterized protein (DUF433 family)
VTSEQKVSLAGVISVNREIMHRTPCFTGTRVPVQTLLDYIEEDDTLDSFLRDFPSVSPNQAISFLEIGKQQLIECVSSWTNALIRVSVRPLTVMQCSPLQRQDGTVFRI